MRLTTIAAHVPVITLLCAPRLQYSYVSSFVFGSGCSSSPTCNARSRTKSHPNKCTLFRCTKDLLVVCSRTVDEHAHEGLKVGCWARSTTRRPATGTRTALYGRGTIDDDDNNETLGSIKDRDDEEPMTSDTSSCRDVPNKVKAPSVTRIGGRSSSPLPARTNGNSSGGIGDIFSVESVQKFVLPVVLLFLLLKALLGGVFVSPSPARSSFVYYQSSTYESRTVDESGNVKTIRKESVRSNMPLGDWHQQMDGIGNIVVVVMVVGTDGGEGETRGGGGGEADE